MVHSKQLEKLVKQFEYLKEMYTPPMSDELAMSCTLNIFHFKNKTQEDKKLREAVATQIKTELKKPTRAEQPQIQPKLGTLRARQSEAFLELGYRQAA